MTVVLHKATIGRIVLLLTSLASLVTATEDAYRTALTQAVAAKEKALDSKRVADWNEVLVRLRIANAHRETPESQYEIAFAASMLGDIGIAVESYQRSLQLGLAGSARRKALAYVADHASSLARLVIRGPSGWQLTLNDVMRGSLPLHQPVLVRPGQATVVLAPDANGVGHWERHLDVEAGRLYELEVQVAAEPLQTDSTPALAPNPNPNETSTAPRHLSKGDLGETSSQSHERHTVRSMPSAKVPFEWSRTGLAIGSAGVTLGILSAMFLPLTAHRISTGKRTLRDNCQIGGDEPDSCLAAKSGRQELAQSASNSIATWQAARTVSWTGLALGLSAAAAGITILVSAQPRAGDASVSPQLSCGRDRVDFAISGQF